VTSPRAVEVDAAALRRLVAAAVAADPERIAVALGSLLSSGTRAAPGDWLTVDQAAHLLAVSTRTVRRRCHDGSLPHRRLGRRLLVARSALDPPSRPVADRTGPERTRR
jgi:excisionase family DNA binding protein